MSESRVPLGRLIRGTAMFGANFTAAGRDGLVFVATSGFEAAKLNEGNSSPPFVHGSPARSAGMIVVTSSPSGSGRSGPAPSVESNVPSVERLAPEPR